MDHCQEIVARRFSSKGSQATNRVVNLLDDSHRGLVKPVRVKFVKRLQRGLHDVVGRTIPASPQLLLQKSLRFTVEGDVYEPNLTG